MPHIFARHSCLALLATLALFLVAVLASSAIAAFGAGGREVSWLHRDHLGPDRNPGRAITRVKAGFVEITEKATYKPFGEQSEVITATALPAAPETKGWIGERFDADAGLQYLNARYYDPVLGMFLQPDWFEVTKAGVGTNRFSYSANDPVNKLDPGGNQDAPSIQSKDEDDELARKCANGCFSGKTYFEQMKDVCLGGGCAIIAAAAGPAAVYYAAVSVPATYSVGMQIGLAEATGMALGATGVVTKAAPAALSTIDDLVGAGIKVTGSPQVTKGPGGMDHAMASTKAAIDEVNSLGGAKAVDEVFFNTTLGKIVDGVTSGKRPDAAVKTSNGALSLIEAASPSQTVQGMLSKIDKMSALIGVVSPGVSVSGWSKTVSDILRGQ